MKGGGLSLPKTTMRQTFDTLHQGGICKPSEDFS
jgi:hypothetical protein